MTKITQIFKSQCPTGLKQQLTTPEPKNDNFAMDKEKTIYRKKIPNDQTDYKRPEKLIIKRLKSQHLENT